MLVQFFQVPSPTLSGLPQSGESWRKNIFVSRPGKCQGILCQVREIKNPKPQLVKRQGILFLASHWVCKQLSLLAKEGCSKNCLQRS